MRPKPSLFRIHGILLKIRGEVGKAAAAPKHSSRSAAYTALNYPMVLNYKSIDTQGACSTRLHQALSIILNNVVYWMKDKICQNTLGRVDATTFIHTHRRSQDSAKRSPTAVGTLGRDPGLGIPVVVFSLVLLALILQVKSAAVSVFGFIFF